MFPRSTERALGAIFWAGLVALALVIGMAAGAVIWAVTWWLR